MSDSFDRPAFGFDLGAAQAREFDQPGLGPADISRGWQASGVCATCGTGDLRPEIVLVDGEHKTFLHCSLGHLEGA